MITQCPSCQTRFRLPLDQVATSRGEVLCGECRAQFNALDYLVIEEGFKTGKPTLTDRALKRDEGENSNTLFLPIDEDVIANLLSEGAPSGNRASAEADIEIHHKSDESPPQLTPITQSTTPDFTDTLIQQVLEIDGEELKNSEPSPSAPEAIQREPTKYQLNSDLENPATEDHQGSLWSALLSVIIVLLLISTLGLQYLVVQREHFAQHPYFRPVLTTICPHLRCTVAPRRDLSRLSVVDTRIETHPQHPEALLISAELSNLGSFEQNYPIVELVMTNIQQEVVASRNFYPDEYLSGYSEDETGYFAANSIDQLLLEVIDPGSHATGFEFILHNRTF